MEMKLTPKEFVTDILSACDASNWDAERHRGEVFRALNEAYEGIQEIAIEYQASMYDWTKRVQEALNIAVQYGGFDGGHHKAWCIDQMVRALTSCPKIHCEAVDYKGTEYTYTMLGESDEYKQLVANAKDGEDGPETYEWNEGTPP